MVILWNMTNTGVKLEAIVKAAMELLLLTINMVAKPEVTVEILTEQSRITTNTVEKPEVLGSYFAAEIY